MSQFSFGKTVVVGVGFLGIAVIWPIFDQYVPVFLQAGHPDFEQGLQETGRQVPQVAGLGLAPSLALFIMTWDNILNVFVQPWVGERSDRTWNRFGRRKPWILVGVPVAMVGFTLIPFAQTALAIAVFILITNVGMSLFRSPTIAWLGDLFEPAQRSQTNGVINLMGGIGALLALFGGGLLFERFGRPAPFVGGAALLAAAALVVISRVKEPPKLTEEDPQAVGVRANLRRMAAGPDKSGLLVLLGIVLWMVAFHALNAGLSSFAVFTLGLSPGRASIYAGSLALSFIVFAMPAGRLGARLGRQRAIRLGLAGMAAGLLAGYVLIHGTATYVLTLILLGACWALINVNGLPLLLDFGDERKIGANTGLYYFATQLGAILGPASLGFVVDLFDDQFRWLFVFGAVFMTLSWLVVSRVRAREGDLL